MLVTVVVLSIGLLGLAGLQASGLRNNHSAYLRTQATFLAMEIADRMRANREAALDGDYDIAMSANAPTDVTIAATDLAAWLNDLDTRLPSGDGAIARTDDFFTITVQWDDTRGAGAVKQFVMETQL
jgi:type IV pilus assembly protein PilV